MQSESCLRDYVTLWVVTCCGHGSGVLKLARGAGVTGGTILYGKSFGTSDVLDYFGLDEFREEIILMATDVARARKTVALLEEEYDMGMEHHLYAFAISVCGIVGAHAMKNCSENPGKGENIMEYQLITVIVDKGRGEDAIDAAIKAGCNGGTLLNARGAGIHETSRVFAMEIEPEKEIALIVCPKLLTRKVVDFIHKDLKMDKPGNGIVYVQNVLETYGV